MNNECIYLIDPFLIKRRWKSLTTVAILITEYSAALPLILRIFGAVKSALVILIALELHNDTFGSLIND